VWNNYVQILLIKIGIFIATTSGPEYLLEYAYAIHYCRSTCITH